MATVKVIGSGTGNHRCIIGTELERGKQYLQVMVTGCGLKSLPQTAIGGHATPNRDRL